MLHTEAYALLWMVSGARYERMDVSACAEVARRYVRERVFTRWAGGVEEEGAGDRIRLVLSEAIDTAEAKLRTLAEAGEPSPWMTPAQCVAADRADAEASLGPMKTDDLWGLVFQAAGAATVGMWQRSGEVFPSEEVGDACRRVMADHGFEPPQGYRGTGVGPYEPREA